MPINLSKRPGILFPKEKASGQSSPSSEWGVRLGHSQFWVAGQHISAALGSQPL